MTQMENSLNEEDVRRLLSDPSGETRAEIAGKLAIQHSILGERQRQMAEDIFRIMVKDAEVRVRSALSQQLKENPFIPHDIAVTLAKDVSEVALPMLQFSEVLTEEDLIEIVTSQNDDARQEAVASRAHVTSKLADVLVESGKEEVVKALVGNDGAELSDQTLNKVVEGYAGRDSVGSVLVDRANLPVTVAERLMAKVSENLRTVLSKRRNISPEMATTLLLQAREMAVLGLTESNAEVSKLVDHLYRNGRLTPSIVLRAICMGDMLFFEDALAKLGRLSLGNAQRLIHDPGKRGFQALFRKTAIPNQFYRAMRAAVDVSREMEYDGHPHDRERFSRRMIERVLTQYGDLGVEFESEDLDYLMAKMSQLPMGMGDESEEAGG